MRGFKDFNFPYFFEAARILRAQGHTVFNPAERDTQAHGAEKLKSETGSETEVAQNLGMNRLQLARECFLADTRYICGEADAIYLLPGWKKSKGAVAEHALAVAIGLEVRYLKK